MADQNSTPPAGDDSAVEGKFKQWINDVLDEREAKSVADREEADKQAAEKAAKARSNSPLSMLEGFLGFTSKKD